MIEKKNEKSLPDIDIVPQVMKEIRDKKIKMRHPLVFLARRAGLESVLILVITGAALLASIILYFLKKTNVLKFINFGWAGVKVIFMTLPYDYIALFIFTILLANYILSRLDLNRKHKFFFNVPAVTLFVVATLIGAFFGIMGIEQIAKGWSIKQIPGNIAISGRVVESSDKKAIIEDAQGNVTEVDFGPGVVFPYKPEYAKDRFLRAIGRLDPGNPKCFHAESIRCCDEY